VKPSLSRRFLGALQFLTVLPVRANTSSPGDAAVFFPLTGILIGASASLVAWFSSLVFGRPLSTLLCVICLTWISGGLHEDGLADVADAVRAGRSRDRMLEILKDSRIGSYGALSLILSVLLRWQAISAIARPAIPGIVAVVALSRASMVIAAGTTPAVGSGLGHLFAAGCDRSTLAAVIAQSIAILVAFGLYAGYVRALALFVVSGAVLWAARAWLVRRLGGVNGDCLGATCQAVEVTGLLVLAWQRSF
jgi:adenosylcobinamide-GDP ribazoletransferase